MSFASPLRYPGGKSSMAGVLHDIRLLNDLVDLELAEPFAGGAGASLSLLFGSEAPLIHINDLDPAINAFWQSAVNESEAFLDLLDDATLSIEDWKQWRAVYLNKDASRLERGFATFYLNRCNRSGIIKNGGPIGGVGQTGHWSLDARFNKETLSMRLRKLAKYREKISITGQDGIEFIESIEDRGVMFFVDPPYFNKGPALYLNSLNKEYHDLLANKLSEIRDRPWILTYDECPEVRRLYSSWASIRTFSLKYTASARRSGNEVMITPRWMKTPPSAVSRRLNWA